ncbi:CENP-Q, a CENPA-CAD centromere complex subunit-domain-containing protein [Dipodascopsis uninucleata]
MPKVKESVNSVSVRNNRKAVRKLDKSKRLSKSKSKESGKDHQNQRKDSKLFNSKETVHKISCDVIQREWGTLSESACENIIDLMYLVTLAVYNSIQSEQRKKQAQEVITDAIEKIRRRLRKLPVPPTANEKNFDYEGVLETNAQLERDLVTDLESISQLEQEIKKERKLYDKDKEYFKELEHNARAQENLRNSQKKKLNKLLRDVTNLQENSGDDSETIGFVESHSMIDSDSSLNSLTSRLSQHLYSISSNISSVEEIVAASRQVESVLCHVLETRKQSNVSGN